MLDVYLVPGTGGTYFFRKSLAVETSELVKKENAAALSLAAEGHAAAMSR